MLFNFKPVATLKAQRTSSDDMIAVNGITTANITPENAATQSNKLLSIVGFDIVANTKMSRVQTEEAIDNG